MSESAWCFRLPVPPSTNNLFVTRRHGAGRAKSPAYEAWIREAGWLLNTQARPPAPLDCRLKVEIEAPFSRRRDLDNLKAALDLLKTMHVIVDDNRVDDLRIVRVAQDRPFTVSLWEVGG